MALATFEGEGLRSKIHKESNGLRIEIPSRGTVFGVILAPLWLMLWVYSFSLILPTAAREIEKFGYTNGAMLPVLLWFLAGTVVAGIWLWNTFGKEVITVNKSLLTTKCDILGLGRVRKFDAARISKIRVYPEVSHMYTMWGLRDGIIVFGYGRKIYRFGTSIDESEAQHIVARIKREGVGVHFIA